MLVLRDIIISSLTIFQSFNLIVLSKIKDLWYLLNIFIINTVSLLQLFIIVTTRYVIFSNKV